MPYELNTHIKQARIYFGPGDHSLIVSFGGGKANPRMFVKTSVNFTMALMRNVVVRSGTNPLILSGYFVLSQLTQDTPVPIPIGTDHAIVKIRKYDDLPALSVAFYRVTEEVRPRTLHDRATEEVRPRERSRSRERSPVRRAYSPTSPEVTLAPPKKFIPVTEMQSLLGAERAEVKALEQLMIIRSVPVPKSERSKVPWYVLDSDIETLRGELKTQVELYTRALFPQASPVAPPELE
jgi:hypothetical protein